MERPFPDRLLEEFCKGPEAGGFAPAVAVVAAHPDDETIGAAARLPRLSQATILHVTDGAPQSMHDAHAAGFATRLDYARARRAESAAALALAGIPLERTRELGFIDQEAALHLVELVERMVEVLREIRPALVVTHPYEGGHPDHDSAAFAVYAAGRLLQAQGMPAPAVVEMTSYHNASGTLVVGEFLPYASAPVRTVILSAAERALKRRMLDCYATQRAVLSLFPVEWERFRSAPRYDFTQPPHPGPLYYEGFQWGMTGSRWRSLARAALGALGLGPPCP